MDTAVRPTQLQVLGRGLQQQLAEQLPHHGSLLVQCAFKQDTLLVLAQHPLEATADARQIFTVLEEKIKSLPLRTAFAVADSNPLLVRLYLRLSDQQRPYAAHAFAVAPAIADHAVMPLASDRPSSGEPIATGESVNAVKPSEPGELGVESLPQLTAEVKAPGALLTQPKPVPEPGHSIILARDAHPSPDSPSHTDVDEPYPHVTEAYEIKPKFVNPLRSSSLPAIALGTAVGLFVLISGFIVLSSPCVVNACVPLQTAEQLRQDADQLIRHGKTAEDITQAYEYLIEGNHLLSTIPPWSKQHQPAQELMSSFETEADVVKKVVIAQQQARLAAEKSQNPPHPLTQWRDVQDGWQQAIALLESVGPNDTIYPFAQRKLAEYNDNLKSINQRILIEQKAQEEVNSARSTAQIAQAREAAANTFENWQLTQTTWQVVVNLLQQVPQSTMAYAEAQQLLAIYQPKLTTAHNRRTQEEISVKAYNQALTLATQAREAEQQQQWSTAVTQWQDALTYAQQIPSGTSYHSQAQPLVASYSASLTTAQSNLRKVVAMRSVESDLNRTCSGSPRVCTYSVELDAIQVRVTSAYDRAVEEAIAASQMRGDYQTQASVANHVNTLLRALAVISENSEIPLQLYNSDGSLFGTYMPNLSGYVPRQPGQ